MLQSIEIDLSRSAYSDTFNTLFNEQATFYLEQMFSKLSKIVILVRSLGGKDKVVDIPLEINLVKKAKLCRS